MLRISGRSGPVLAEARPELELELKLREEATKHERIQETGRLGILRCPIRREVEMARVPPGLARHVLGMTYAYTSVRRIVAREKAKCVRQRLVAARVVERMPRFVQKVLVVLKPALRTLMRDTVHGGSGAITDGRGDFCGRSSRSSWIPDSTRSNPRRGERGQAYVGCPVLRVDALEGGEA